MAGSRMTLALALVLLFPKTRKNPTHISERDVWVGRLNRITVGVAECNKRGNGASRHVVDG